MILILSKAALLPGLMNEIGGFAQPLMLVLDDYHLLAAVPCGSRPSEKMSAMSPLITFVSHYSPWTR